MRAFGKEAAACDRYRDAVLKMQGWGLKSAALGGFFGGFNATFTTGAAVFSDLDSAAGGLSVFRCYACSTASTRHA